jgi:CDP-diacylglycerol--serine O-phosphatidyltransferase
MNPVNLLWTPSNALTFVSLTSGVGAVASAFEGNARLVGVCLAAAALADTFDGRFARSFRRTREMAEAGAQLDSLVDGVVFGVVPIAAASLLIGQRPGFLWTAWWLSGAFYVACTLSRLAFYNVHAASGQSDGFIGLPTPVAALVWSTTLLVTLNIVGAIVTAVALGAAMVAPIPIARPRRSRLAVFALWPIVLIVAYLARP